MGDRTWTAIQFSGDIKPAVAFELLDLLDNQCDGADGPTGSFTMEHLLIPHNQFTDDECNYAQMEDIEAFCTEHGVSYRKSWASGCEYSAGFEIYDAKAKQTWQRSDVDGEPVLGLSELVTAHKEHKIAGLIAELKRFTEWEQNYPPIGPKDELWAAHCASLLTEGAPTSE